MKETKLSAPTIIPAHPGWKHVWFWVEGGVSKTTKASEIHEGECDVIAWSVQSFVSEDNEIDYGHTVRAIGPNGDIEADDVVVSPDRRFHFGFEEGVYDDHEAKTVWLERQKAKL